MSLVLLDRSVDVHVRDVNPDRVAFAMRLGATAAALDDDERRFDLVVDTVGSPGTADVALGSLEVGGTLLLLGLDNHPWEVTAQTIVRRQAVVRGSLTYDHPADFEAAIRIVADEGFGPGRIVSDEYPLADAQAAFDHSPSAAGKTWIRIAEKS